MCRGRASTDLSWRNWVPSTMWSWSDPGQQPDAGDMQRLLLDLVDRDIIRILDSCASPRLLRLPDHEQAATP